MTLDDPAELRPEHTSDSSAARRARREAKRFTTGPHLPGRRLNSVFWVSVTLIVAILAAGAVFPVQMNAAAGAAMRWVTATSGWSLLVIPLGLIGLLLVIALSPFGRIRLGPDDSRPEYPTLAWIAMLLGAVMGIGMITYGVAEPVSHLVRPPHGLTEAGSREAVEEANRRANIPYKRVVQAVEMTPDSV